MKKPLLIALLIALPVTCGLGAFLITHFVEQNNAKKKKDELAYQAFQLHYADRVALFKEENKHLNNVDVSFVGDSLTEGYDVKTYYSEYNVVNRGIGGDTTFGVENRLDVSVYDVNPKVVSLLIGANNFDTMLQNYETIVSKIRTNEPEAKVILCSLTSMTGNWGRNNEKARNNNIKIKEIAEQYSCAFADLYNPLLDPDTNALKEEYSVDGGHLKPAGYEVVTSIIKTILKTLI